MLGYLIYVGWNCIRLCLFCDDMLLQVLIDVIIILIKQWRQLVFVMMAAFAPLRSAPQLRIELSNNESEDEADTESSYESDSSIVWANRTFIAARECARPAQAALDRARLRRFLELRHQRLRSRSRSPSRDDSQRQQRRQQQHDERQRRWHDGEGQRLDEKLMKTKLATQGRKGPEEATLDEGRRR